MKFLTLRQPWASLIALGVKTIETRSWSTSFRGPLAIHAGKAQPGSFERVGDWVTSMWGDGSWSMVERPSGSLDPVRCVELPLGAVVAVADLVDVVPIHEWMCSCDLADGPYALVSGTSMGPESIVGLFYAPSGAGFKHPMWGPSSLDCLDPRHPRQQAPFGDFQCGRYAWLLDNIRALPAPVPMKGAQGLRDVPHDVLPLLLDPKAAGE